MQKIGLENKVVLITGVAGFIGANLAVRLLSSFRGIFADILPCRLGYEPCGHRLGQLLDTDIIFATNLHERQFSFIAPAINGMCRDLENLTERGDIEILLLVYNHRDWLEHSLTAVEHRFEPVNSGEQQSYKPVKRRYANSHFLHVVFRLSRTYF